MADILSCGILVKDFGTSDSFKFAHKSFLELLVSKFCTIDILGKKEKDDENERLIYNSIRKALKITGAKLEKSPDVIRFGSMGRCFKPI